MLNLTSSTPVAAVIATPTTTTLPGATTDNQWVGSSINVITFILIFSISRLTIALYSLIKNQQPPQPCQNHYANRSQSRDTNQLQKTLLAMVNGDRETAQRLFNYAKLNNPSRPVDWCLEKVILDLERDRR